MAYNVRRMGMRQVARQRMQHMSAQRRQRHSMRQQHGMRQRYSSRSRQGSSYNRPIMARGGISRPQGRRRAAMHGFGRRFLGRGIGSRPGFNRPMARGRFTFPTRGY